MVDQDLRGLERAAADGDASACVAWARALERLGRRDEAVGAYLAALDRDPAAAEARAALGALPAWTGTHGDAGRSGALDVQPLRGAPRRLWHAPPATPASPGLRRFSEPYLLGGEAGLLALHPAPARVEALDARDGRRLWSAEGWADRNVSHVVGDAVVLAQGGSQGPGLATRDLRTGEVLARAPSGVAAGASGFAPGLHLRASTPGNLWRLDAWTQPSPRTAPAGEPRWTVVRPLEHRGRSLIAAGDLVVVAFTGGDVAALEAATGDERWRATGAGLHGDADGVAIRRDDVYTLFDHAGRARWSHVGRDVLALGREHVVMAAAGLGLGPDFRLPVLDRATGGVRAELVTYGPVLACAMARDVVYVAGTHGLDVFSVDGERLWRVLADDLPGRVPVALVPLERRLVVGMQSGDVLMLGDDA